MKLKICDMMIDHVIDELYWDIKNTHDKDIPYLNSVLEHVRDYFRVLKTCSQESVVYTPFLSPIEDSDLQRVRDDVFVI